MVCSICGQAGHNRRTCPHRNTTGLSNTQNRRGSGINIPLTQGRRILTKKLWKKTIQTIVDLQRFLKVSLNLNHNREKLKYAYFHWLKIKDIFVGFFPGYPHTLGACILGVLNLDSSQYKIHVINTTNEACIEFHKVKNPVKDNKRKIKLINMKNENYLIYWVVGNLMIEDLDSKENTINYWNRGLFGRKCIA